MGYFVVCERTIITIDGPAGTGKSTVAHRLAKRLGLEFLDTGAMYRAATLIALENGVAADDGLRLASLLLQTDLHFNWSTDPPALTIDGRDVSDRIRDLDVSEQVSIVAASASVREVLVDLQRRIAARHPRLVTEGRDQGSVVFPDADVRFFLDASPEIRADRRHEQLTDLGKTVTREEILHDVRRRDQLDSTRPVAPLVCPVGAHVIVTDDLDINGVVDRLERIVRDQLSIGDPDTERLAARNAR